MERARSRSRWLPLLWRLTQLPVLALQLLATVAPAVALIGLLPRDSEGELCCDAMPASMGAGSDSQYRPMPTCPNISCMGSSTVRCHSMYLQISHCKIIPALLVR